MALTKSDKEWINLVLAPLKQDISTIKETTHATNGQVKKHEFQITEAIAERKGNRESQKTRQQKVEELQIRTELLEKSDLNHIVNCPVSPGLRVVEDQMVGFMAEVRIRTKIFSKTSQVVIIIIMAVTLFLSFYNASVVAQTKKELVTLENTK